MILKRLSLILSVSVCLAVLAACSKPAGRADETTAPASAETTVSTTSLDAPETQTPAGPSLAYTSNGDGTCSVTGIGDITDADVTVPEKSPAGDTVTSVAPEAFKDVTSLEIIRLPSSVKSIGENAFNGCLNLYQLRYAGTMAEFFSIELGPYWSPSMQSLEIVCSDRSTMTN